MSGFLLTLLHANANCEGLIASPLTLTCWRPSPLSGVAGHFPAPDSLEGPRTLTLHVQPISGDICKARDCKATSGPVVAVINAERGHHPKTADMLPVDLLASAVLPDSLDGDPNARGALNFLRRRRGVATVNGQTSIATAAADASQQPASVESEADPHATPH